MQLSKRASVPPAIEGSAYTGVAGEASTCAGRFTNSVSVITPARNASAIAEYALFISLLLRKVVCFARTPVVARGQATTALMQCENRNAVFGTVRPQDVYRAEPP